MVLRLRNTAPSNNWEGAKCHRLTITADEDPFFSEDEIDLKEAINFCNGEADGIVCPIRDQCLHFALVNNERFGVWGGTSEITRRAIRKKWPSKGGKPNENWKWLTEQEALQGLKREKLMQEAEEELLNQTED